MASKSKDVNQIIKSVYIIKPHIPFCKEKSKILQKKFKNVVIIDYQAIIFKNIPQRFLEFLGEWWGDIFENKVLI